MEGDYYKTRLDKDEVEGFIMEKPLYKEWI